MYDPTFYKTAENVGRQGTLPNGIEIVTEADYFAVGNRTKAYLEIAVFIAQFPQYTFALAQHLADVKLAHWDRAVRELAATALNRITFRCPEEVARLLKEKVFIRGKSIDLNTRHGNILAIGECVRALCDAKRYVAFPCECTSVGGWLSWTLVALVV